MSEKVSIKISHSEQMKMVEEERAQRSLDLLLDLDPKSDANRAGALGLLYFQKALKRAAEYSERGGGDDRYLNKIKGAKGKVVPVLKAVARYFAQSIQPKTERVEQTESCYWLFECGNGLYEEKVIPNRIRDEIAEVAQFYGLSLEDLRK